MEGKCEVCGKTEELIEIKGSYLCRKCAKEKLEEDLRQHPADEPSKVNINAEKSEGKRKSLFLLIVVVIILLGVCINNTMNKKPVASNHPTSTSTTSSSSSTSSTTKNAVTGEEYTENDNKIVYEIMNKCSKHFKNPASLRLVDGYLSTDKTEVTARVTAENGYGGHNARLAVMKKNGDTTIFKKDDEEKNGNELMTIAKYSGVEIDVEKANDLFAQHHK